MADLERFKQQSPVTTDSPAVKCKRLRSDFGVATEKKETATGPCENKDTYLKDITCSHAMLTLLTLTI